MVFTLALIPAWTRSLPLSRPCGPPAAPDSFRRFPSNSSRAKWFAAGSDGNNGAPLNFAISYSFGSRTSMTLMPRPGLSSTLILRFLATTTNRSTLVCLRPTDRVLRAMKRAPPSRASTARLLLLWPFVPGTRKHPPTPLTPTSSRLSQWINAMLWPADNIRATVCPSARLREVLPFE